jgi:hypothetical protein
MARKAERAPRVLLACTQSQALTETQRAVGVSHPMIYKGMDKVARLSCCLCGAKPVEPHHILEGRTPGRRSPDWWVIPLCSTCHRDNHNGIHGAQAMLKIVKKNELELLAETLARIYA